MDLPTLKITNPIISIIIPMYNVEPYIVRCLKSVVEQTYKNFEIILVDDCSIDNTVKIADDYLRNSNVVYDIIKHDKNKLQAVARNRGLESAVGEYVYFLDSDDAIDHETLFMMVNFAQKNNLDVVLGEVQVFNDPKVDVSHKLDNLQVLNSCSEITTSLIRNEYGIIPVNKLIRKNILTNNNILFPEGVYHEDYLWSFNLALNSQRMGFLKKSTYYYFRRADSSTGTIKEKNILDFLFTYGELFSLFTKNKEIFSTLDVDVYLEHLRFHILLVCPNYQLYKKAEREMRNIYPMKLNRMFNLSFDTKLKIKMLMQYFPSFLSHNILKYRFR